MADLFLVRWPKEKGADIPIVYHDPIEALKKAKETRGMVQVVWMPNQPQKVGK